MSNRMKREDINTFCKFRLDDKAISTSTQNYSSLPNITLFAKRFLHYGVHKTHFPYLHVNKGLLITL